MPLTRGVLLGGYTVECEISSAALDQLAEK
jgi:hypothetical protein